MSRSLCAVANTVAAVRPFAGGASARQAPGRRTGSAGHRGPGRAGDILIKFERVAAPSKEGRSSGIRNSTFDARLYVFDIHQDARSKRVR